MAQRLPVVGSDGGTWGTILNGYLGPALGVDGAMWINVKDPAYGAKGDGTTDDTAAIQAAVNATVVSIDQTKMLFFPAGKYKISTEIVIPTNPGIELVGTGMYSTIIEQQTAGHPVIYVKQVGSSDRSPPLHSFAIRNMALNYPSAQTNVASIAVYYDWASPSIAGTVYFNHLYEDIRIFYAYKGFAFNNAHGTDAIWSSTWRRIFMAGIKQSCFDFVSAGTAGQPILCFYDCLLDNAGSGVTSTGPMFNLEAVGECVMTGMDLEGWYDTIANVDSCNVKIQGLHLENNFFNSAFSKMFIVSNGSLSIDTFTCSGNATTANNTDQTTMVQADASGRVDLRNGFHNVDCTLGTSYIRELVYSGSLSNNPRISVFNVTKAGGGLSDPGTGTRAAEVGEFLFGGRRQLTYSGTISPGDLSLVGSRRFWWSVTNGTSFTIANTSNARADDRITFEIQNANGTNIGTAIWGSEYKLSGGTWTQPASTKKRTVSFYRDPVNTLWIEECRTTADI